MADGSVVVVFQNASAAPELPPQERFEAWVHAALADGVCGELVLRVVDRRESRDLNRSYRGKNQPTNVLAFPAAPLAISLPPAEPAPIGDLVLCAPVVFAEAAEEGIAAEAHWAHMVIHGCLHLLGFDHGTNAEASVMEARESELLRQLGFADPQGSE